MNGVLTDQATYYLGSEKEIVEGLNWKAEEIVDALTLQTNQTITEPMATQYKLTSQLNAILSADFMMAIIFLVILVSMLVFSLMLSDVDGKTYEYGMLRALGFKKPYLMAMITINSFYFSIPGCIGGICLAFVMNVFLRQQIFLVAQNTLDYDLSTLAIILGLICGLLMPFISNFFPIRSAMS